MERVYQILRLAVQPIILSWVVIFLHLPFILLTLTFYFLVHLKTLDAFLWITEVVFVSTIWIVELTGKYWFKVIYHLNLPPIFSQPWPGGHYRKWHMLMKFLIQHFNNIITMQPGTLDFSSKYILIFVFFANCQKIYIKVLLALNFAGLWHNICGFGPRFILHIRDYIDKILVSHILIIG